MLVKERDPLYIVNLEDHRYVYIYIGLAKHSVVVVLLTKDCRFSLFTIFVVLVYCFLDHPTPIISQLHIIETSRPCQKKSIEYLVEKPAHYVCR